MSTIRYRIEDAWIDPCERDFYIKSFDGNFYKVKGGDNYWNGTEWKPIICDTLLNNNTDLVFFLDNSGSITAAELQAGVYSLCKFFLDLIKNRPDYLGNLYVINGGNNSQSSESFFSLYYAFIFGTDINGFVYKDATRTIFKQEPTYTTGNANNPGAVLAYDNVRFLNQFIDVNQITTNPADQTLFNSRLKSINNLPLKNDTTRDTIFISTLNENEVYSGAFNVTNTSTFETIFDYKLQNNSQNWASAFVNNTLRELPISLYTTEVNYFIDNVYPFYLQFNTIFYPTYSNIETNPITFNQIRKWKFFMASIIHGQLLNSNSTYINLINEQNIILNTEPTKYVDFTKLSSVDNNLGPVLKDYGFQAKFNLVNATDEFTVSGSPDINAPFIQTLKQLIGL